METRLTVPNVITIARIAMSLAAGVLVLAARAPAFALSLLVAGALLDAFDGWYARAFRRSSHLGMHLDPFADKVLVAVMYAWIGRDAGSAWVWAGIALVVARDAAMTALRAWSVRRRARFIPASGLGRLKMFLQCSTGLTILGFEHWLERPVPAQFVVVALCAVLVVSFASAAAYTRAWLREGVRGAPPAPVRVTEQRGRAAGGR